MKIYLRPITLEDGRLIVKWRNSEQVSLHCFNKNHITEESNKVFFERNIVTGKYKQFIVERVDEAYEAASYPIATVYLKDMDTVNRRCELCIFTSDDEEWNNESQKIAIQLLLDKAFNEYGMHKVYSHVYFRFLEEVDLLKKAGFSAEAILKDEAIDENGNFEDIVRFSIINKKE